MERPSLVYDLTELNGEDDISLEELREELALLKLKTSKEDERLRRLVHGSGTGRPKSAEFEFASRTIALEGLLRKVPTLNVGTTRANALKLRKDMKTAVCLQATQTDDPWLIFLTTQYVGKICFLHDIADRHKLFRVSNIAYWTSTKTRFANWEATLEPVHLSASGDFYVADEDVIVGPKGIRLTKSNVLLGYILAQYIDGDDEEPTRTECVDRYVENALDKLKAYVFKLQQHVKPSTRLT